MHCRSCCKLCNCKRIFFWPSHVVICVAFSAYWYFDVFFVQSICFDEIGYWRISLKVIRKRPVKLRVIKWLRSCRSAKIIFELRFSVNRIKLNWTPHVFQKIWSSTFKYIPSALNDNQSQTNFLNISFIEYPCIVETLFAIWDSDVKIWIFCLYRFPHLVQFIRFWWTTFWSNSL